MSVDASRSTRAPSPGWLVLAAYTLAGLLLGAGLVFRTESHVVADNQPDEALVEWFIGWTAHALANFNDVLVTPVLNAPTGVNAMWNTGLLLPSLLLTPLTLLAGAHTTYVLLLVAGPILSAFTACLCLRRLCRGWAGPFLGGLLYGFSPALVHHAHGHPHISLAFLVPPILLLVVEACTGTARYWRVGLAAGALVAAQLLTGEEMLLFTAVVAVLLVVHLGLRRPGEIARRLPRLLAIGGVAAGTALVLAGYPLYRQFSGPLTQYGSPLSADFFKVDVANIYTATKGELLAGGGALETAQKFQPGFPELGGYLGMALLLLCAVTVLGRRREATVVVSAFLLVELVVLSFGNRVVFEGVPTRFRGPFGLVEKYPVAENALTSRLPVFTALMAGVLLALAVDRGWGRGTDTARMAPWRVAAGVLCLLPLIPRPLPSLPAPAIPSFFTTDAVRAVPAESVALLLPYPTPTSTEPMRWQVAADFHFLMPGGFFIGPDASGRAFFTANQLPSATLLNDIALKGQAPDLTPDARRVFAEDLVRWQARTVVLGPHEHHDLLRAAVESLLGRPPDSAVGGVELWRL